MADDQLARRITDRLEEIFGAQPMLCVAPISQEAVELARHAQEAGAPAVLALAHRHGTGALGDDVEVICLADGDGEPAGEVDAASMMGGIRAGFSALADLPAAVTARVDAWDPAGRARVFGSILAAEGTTAGRASFGARPAAWEALEDKLLLDRLWRSAGLTPPPNRIVELSDRRALTEAHEALATDQGTVWAGDNQPGWHGGGDAVRWVPDDAEVPAVADELAPIHDRVRIMPFVDGVPCSVHGMVLGDGTAAFRPAEMVILRDRAARRFVYAKAATFWDPRPEDRDHMREVARRVGEQLRDEVDYRGVFTIDGIMGRDGFVPTEVNPRYGGALGSFIRSVEPALNLAVINTAVVEGALDIEHERFERLIVADHDGSRRGMLLTPTAAPPGGDRHLEVVPDGDSIRTRELAGPDEAVDDAIIVLSWGPTVAGGLLIGGFNGSAVPIGPSVAGLAADILAEADRSWRLGLPALEPAPDVRSPAARRPRSPR